MTKADFSIIVNFLVPVSADRLVLFLLGKGFGVIPWGATPIFTGGGKNLSSVVGVFLTGGPKGLTPQKLQSMIGKFCDEQNILYHSAHVFRGNCSGHHCAGNVQQSDEVVTFMTGAPP